VTAGDSAASRQSFRSNKSRGSSLFPLQACAAGVFPRGRGRSCAERDAWHRDESVPGSTRTGAEKATTPLDLFDLKGIVETLLSRLRVTGCAFVPAEHPTFQRGRRTARLMIGETEVACSGR